MVKVYFSHLGNPILKGVRELSCRPGTVLDVLKQVNAMPGRNGSINCILDDDNRVLSSARLFKNVSTEPVSRSLARNSTTPTMQSPETELPLLYETEQTTEISNAATEVLEDGDNLLVSLFEPQYLKKFFEDVLMRGSERFTFNRLDGSTGVKDYRPILDSDDIAIIPQPIYGFRAGETSLQSLETQPGNPFFLELTGEGLVKPTAKLLPAELVEAVCKIWELPDKNGRLRLFQEDSLFFILAKLMGKPYPAEETLLLSMPTGGGKTEAFVIPLLAHIFKQKELEYKRRGSVEKRIRSIIIYPTNALANDQAKRLVELIYLLNEEIKLMPTDRKVTIGIFTGDTPGKAVNLRNDSLIQICPKCGNSDFDHFTEQVNGKEEVTLQCNAVVNGRRCGHRLNYCRLTREQIVSNPPDILITNPDEINVALHSPKYAPIFYNKVDAVVFDEVHMYEGIFGCHVAHLLRRLEAASGYKPLYIGLTATIGNAQELAALLFNVPVAQVKYINNKDNRYTTNEPQKMKYHALLRPVVITKNNAVDSQERKHYERTITTAFVLGMLMGHMVADPHFRKTIIFANYRSDADDIAKFLKERDEIDFLVFIQSVWTKLKNGQPLDDEEAEIGVWVYQWFRYIVENGVPNANLLQVGWNRGGLEKEARIRSVHAFSANQIIREREKDAQGNVVLERDTEPVDVMVATKTLELGIDIGDVSTVINSSAPFTANEYVQRVGRAGRKKNGLAITVINPENAIDAYFAKRFREFITSPQFEDAPIIVTNEVVVRRHLEARILDYVTRKLIDLGHSNGIIKVSDFVRALAFSDETGREVTFAKNCDVSVARKIARYLFDKAFTDNRLNNDVSVMDAFTGFLDNEAEVLAVGGHNIDASFVLQALEDKLLEIHGHFREGRDFWQDFDNIVGPKAVDHTLSPSLRGSGATVGLYLGDDDKPKDVVSRQSAFNSMPKNAPASSGVSTFIIQDVKGEPDLKTQTLIKKTIRKNDEAIRFFANKFPDFPTGEDDLIDNFNVAVPRDYRVRYYPERFYCKACGKGLTKDEIYETKQAIQCSYCRQPVNQLSQIYLCADAAGCGNLYEPPVPRSCLNPACPDFQRFFNNFKANGFRYRKEHSAHFRFRMTRDMEWVCLKCGAKMNFCTSYNMINANPQKHEMLNKVVKVWEADKKTPTGLAVYMKKNPEFFWDNGHNVARFSCGKCPKKVIKTVQVPRARSIAFTFVKKDDKQLVAARSSRLGELSFTTGQCIQLAREYFRRYSVGTSKNETRLKFFRIFEQDLYLGNHFSTHLTWLKIGEALDEFINSDPGCSGDCQECIDIEGLDLGNIIRPKPWMEEYDWDQGDQRVRRRPDPREHFCDAARDGSCPNPSCLACPSFSSKKKSFLRYITVHTLKHAILWGLPKYAGVNLSGVRAEIYPNDGQANADLVFIDSDEGGSGAIILMAKHWDKIWEFAREVIEMSAKNMSNLLLPHTCSRYNQDLCPFLARRFIRFLDSRS